MTNVDIRFSRVFTLFSISFFPITTMREGDGEGEQILTAFTVGEAFSTER